MAYVNATPISFFTEASTDQVRKAAEPFCKAVFPGSRPYTSYQGSRVSVYVQLGLGASASVVIESREPTPAERVAGEAPVNARVTVSGYVSGVAVQQTPAGTAEVQRFFREVASSFESTLEGLAPRGAQSPTPTRRVTLPRFEDPGREIA